MFFIKPVKAISDVQLLIITQEATSIKQINNYETYYQELENLNVECLICWYTLNHLSKECLIAYKLVENNLMLKNNKLRTEKTKLFKTKGSMPIISFIKKLFTVLIKATLTIFLAPFFLLFWVFQDPYQDIFCVRHYEVRPIKLERIRRWTLYLFAAILWILLISVIWYIIYTFYK